MESVLDFIKEKEAEIKTITIDLDSSDSEEILQAEEKEILLEDETGQEVLIFLEVEINGVASKFGGDYFDPLEVHVKASFKIIDVIVYLDDEIVEFSEENEKELIKLLQTKINLKY